MGFCVRSLFYFAALCVLFMASFAIIQWGKRALAALLLLNSERHVAVIVLYLFLNVS